MADDLFDLPHDTPASQAKAVLPANIKLKYGPLPQLAGKFALTAVPSLRNDPQGLAVVPAQDAPTLVHQESSRIGTVPAAALAVFSQTSKHSNAYDSEKYADAPEITHHILPAHASAAICVDGVRVDAAVLPEFRSIFRFDHFNKMQSACLQAVSSGISVY